MEAIVDWRVEVRAGVSSLLVGFKTFFPSYSMVILLPIFGIPLPNHVHSGEEEPSSTLPGHQTRKTLLEAVLLSNALYVKFGS